MPRVHRVWWSVRGASPLLRRGELLDAADHGDLWRRGDGGSQAALGNQQHHRGHQMGGERLQWASQRQPQRLPASDQGSGLHHDCQAKVRPGDPLTVVSDSGANTGLIVSSTGFQRGAVAAAAFSNLQLLDWIGFQTMFAVRWLREYMAPTLAQQTDALHQYTEPFNSRIVRRTAALPADRLERFKVLQERYFPLALSISMFHPAALDWMRTGQSPLPTLPLRTSMDRPYGRGLEGLVPDDVLDATALRPLMDALIEHSRLATFEFDEIFGERA